MAVFFVIVKAGSLLEGFDEAQEVARVVKSVEHDVHVVRHNAVGEDCKVTGDLFMQIVDDPSGQSGGPKSRASTVTTESQEIGALANVVLHRKANIFSFHGQGPILCITRNGY